jgi:hypothetical protein
MDPKTRLPVEIPAESTDALIDSLVAEPAAEMPSDKPSVEVRVEATPRRSPAAKPAGQSPEERRAQMLARYLEIVLPQSQDGALTPVPETIDIDGYVLELEPWERKLLEQSTADGDDEYPDWAPHIIEGLAFEAMASSLLQRLEGETNPAPGEMNQLSIDLATAACVGFALQQELQRDLNRLVVKGEVAGAKRLTNFRNKIVHDVAAIKERISPDAFDQAEKYSEQLVTPFVQPTRQRKSLFENYKAQPRRSTVMRTYAPGPPVAEPVEAVEPVKRDNRLKPMLMMLAVIIVGWMALVLPQLIKTKIPVLDPSQFAHIETIRNVTARPPSLFVHVGTARWASLPEAQKLALIDDLASVAAAAGYTGIQISTTEGLTVGQWLEKTGSRVLDHQREAS